MPAFIGTTDDGNDLLSTCPPFCQGHMDPDTYGIHTTDLDYFGKNGPVVAIKIDGQSARVALVDLPHTQAEFTETEARTLADQLRRAADVVARANQAETHGNVLSAFVLGLLASAGRQANRSAPAGTELAA